MTIAKRLCLNMIVKNEMANLERCLGAVAGHIAGWVICDTGSSDGTQDFIAAYFAGRGLPGELHSAPFVNFEQARNAALSFAEASALSYDYVLLVDADMELVVDDARFRERLAAPGYLLRQRAQTGFTYWNPRLVRRDAGARYRGATHEYLDVPGGSEKLGEVWFRDHASGSNRTDKFKWDIQVLTEALEQEPENPRSWFYLAQSYRDDGQTEKAILAYAKRAEMGGWPEEAWLARLELAVCLRDLGDEAGFVRQAMTAFDQRPQRAEPLYELARFYRERDMHDASLPFSETGLAIPYPGEETLVLDDFVYTAGLREEYSIAAHYSSDRARKERGHAVCNGLALDRDIPARTRDLARRNLFFWGEPAHSLMLSFASEPLGFVAPDGYLPGTLSVARRGEDIVVVQDCVNASLTPDQRPETDNGEPARTRNFLLRLGSGLDIRSSAEIRPPADLPHPRLGAVLGFADMRPFASGADIWCLATTRELNPEGLQEQVLARIDDAQPGAARLCDWRVLRSPERGPHERNWMPLVDAAGKQLRFVTGCDPTTIVGENATTISESAPAIAADHFIGGSQLIPFDDGWLAIIHETEMWDGERQCRHRFVWFDKAARLARLTRTFFFHDEAAAEYATGLAWHVDGERVLLSYSIQDRESWIGMVDASEVSRLLADAVRLPHDMLRRDGTTNSSLLDSTRRLVFPGQYQDPTVVAARPGGDEGGGKARTNGTESAADAAKLDSLPIAIVSKDAAANDVGNPVHRNTATFPRSQRHSGAWSRHLRFHILGVPHTASNKNYVACANTQKVVKLCRLLKERGHIVIHYGNEASDVICDEHVTVTTQDDLIKTYGFEEWKTNVFRFNLTDHAYQTFYRNSIREVSRRKRKNDFLLCVWGSGHRPVADAHPDMITVEPSIGYPRGQFAKFKVFQSYALLHAHFGAAAVERSDKLDSYAMVIPNFFNLDEFEFSAEKDDYFLFLGRVNFGKGVHVALQVAERIGAKLIVAGQGNLDNVGYAKKTDNVEFVGYADVERRKKLMSRAKGFFLAAQYIEPFGNVQIESLLSGTPTITSDWGAFAENNLHGITGYRCRTFDHFVWAAQNIGRIDPHVCRRWAEDNFAIERVGEMYEEFFQSVMDIYTGNGWYESHPDRTNLNWLTRYYPNNQDLDKYS